MQQWEKATKTDRHKRRCSSLKVNVAGRHRRFRVTGDSWATYIPTNCIKSHQASRTVYCYVHSSLHTQPNTNSYQDSSMEKSNYSLRYLFADSKLLHAALQEKDTDTSQDFVFIDFSAHSFHSL